MKDEIFLGCDIGTGSCKIIAKKSSGDVIDEVQVFYELSHPQNRYSEQSPETIKQAFIECVQKINRRLPSHPAAIGFSSCMHSLILIDAGNDILYPMVTWEDTRSHQIAAELNSSKKGKRLYEQTGTPIHSMSVLCKISWFQRNRRDLFDRTSRFIGIKEYIWHWMFGVFEVDYSIASATGLFNIHRLEWDKSALSFCNISKNRLSSPVHTLTLQKNPSREFLQKTGLPENISYCIGASDGCLANVGSGVNAKKKAAITIGTSGAVRVTRSKPVVDHETMIFNYILDEKNVVSGGPINNGGNAMKWLMSEFTGAHLPDQSDYDDLEKQISQIPAGSEGLVCVPWFSGERAPVWDERASGIWFGVRYHHTRFHLIRAALEGICFTLKKIMERIEAAEGNISEVYVSGGFIHSNEWLRMLADIIQKKLIIKTSADASSIGAAMWAEKAMGTKKPVTGSDNERTILPDTKNKNILNQQYHVFCSLYRKTRDEMHALQH